VATEASSSESVLVQVERRQEDDLDLAERSLGAGEWLPDGGSVRNTGRWRAIRSSGSLQFLSAGLTGRKCAVRRRILAPADGGVGQRTDQRCVLRSKEWKSSERRSLVLLG